MREYDIDPEPLEQTLQSLEDEAKTAMLVATDGRLAGVIAVADTLKEDSIAAIGELHRMGLETAMITGDNQRTADAIAYKVGIDYVLAEVLPDGKVTEVQNLQEQFGMVAFVGDGINDAPALTQANVGIAISSITVVGNANLLRREDIRPSYQRDEEDPKKEAENQSDSLQPERAVLQA